MNEMVNIAGQQVSVLELLAFITGIVGVWLTAKENILNFPVGIINVALYAWLFYSPGVRLYADALLQLIYIVLLIYGWYLWSVKKKSLVLIVTKTSSNDWLAYVPITLIGTLTLGYFLAAKTNASLPYADSGLTMVSLLAQYLTSKKKIESWLIWIVTDLVYVIMYMIKDLKLTALLYIVFILLAIFGFNNWKRIRLKELQ